MERKVKIIGTGVYLPKQRVTSDEMDRKLGVPAGWSLKKSEVRVRYFVENETAAEMGAFAAQAALQDAGLTFADIDCIVCASGTMQQPIPCTAALIQQAMGKGNSGVPSFDINSTCLSFLAALDVMSYLIAAGRYQRILIVSTEVASVGLNWEHKESAVLFGDGAAAVIVGQATAYEQSRIAASLIETYSTGASYSEIRGGGTGLHAKYYDDARMSDYMFHMDGQPIYKMASKLLPDFLERLLGSGNTTMSQFPLIIPHQGSAMAMRLISRKLGIAPEQLMNITSDHGNTIAASIPMGLHEAIHQGRVQRGDRILLLGTSAGLSLGGLVLEY
ncbi:beta-ketoacyl-ACP synthase III [Paenibacillus sp. NAIST15-1]|uniref:beta-ketoacyl-ACP synthase III n=1 Tax=Paenibacillus sp. NAIST15-1 TaxID=1605994 RepID=UPI000868CC8A|nr:beta-ketoacyl-ACP synthase III [Paenibacillus sp. NAIST15-1]GAV10757.1 3-oxoacyl-(Acyl carrier protein) synthase III [Paenibacillus sp. NAIST15-1]